MTGGRPYTEDQAERYAFVRSLLQDIRPAPADLVELGAAPGAQALGLAAAGYRVTAVDLGEASDAWGAQPEGTMEAALGRQGVNFVTWDLERTPYPLEDETVDVVLLTEVLEHLRDYPAQALAEARRLMRPDGLLVLTTPNAAYLGNRVKLALGHSVVTSLDDWIYGLPHARHVSIPAPSLNCSSGTSASNLYSSLAGTFTPQAALARRPRVGKMVVNEVAKRRPTLGPALGVVAARA